MHIVVVDPSRTTLKAISLLLEREGHIARGFTDGQEALGFIDKNKSVNALITSSEIVSMSGLELCWQTRLLSGYDRAIYIILMSSNSEQENIVSALDGGADEFIRKPPASEELYARLRSADRMLQLQEKLIRLARVDPLTGTLNRRAFFDEAQRQCRSATSAAKPVAIMFDVDHFKQVNDQFGHDIGDMVLRAIGENVPSHSATVGRLGGEEFAILIENSDLAAGVELSENLRTKLAALSFDTLLGDLSITCSFGVSEWRDGETIDELLKRADIALYTAKNDGRNRIVSETAFHRSLNKHLQTSSIRARSREESIA